MASQASTHQPFAGKVAIVTGAASGIGLATTELLHALAVMADGGMSVALK